VNPEDLAGYLLAHLLGGGRPSSLVGTLWIGGALHVFGSIGDRDQLEVDLSVPILRLPARNGPRLIIRE
jgi:hypothetical protein